MNRKIAFNAVSAYECRCGTSFDTKGMKSTDPPDYEDFIPDDRDPFMPDESEWEDSLGIEFDCSECGLSWIGRIDQSGQSLRIRLKSEDWLVRRGLKNAKKVELDNSEGQRIIELLSELHKSAAILKEHFERLKEDSRVDGAEIDEKDEIQILADIKAYLAEAYSFERTYDTLIKLNIPEKSRAERLFEEYKKQSKVVNGLRIYTQKERNLDLRYRLTFEGSVEPIVETESVKVMESMKSSENPDGYRGGHEQYYSHLESGEINLRKVLENHIGSVMWLVGELTKALVQPDSKAHEDISEWIDRKEQYYRSLLYPEDLEETE